VKKNLKINMNNKKYVASFKEITSEEKALVGGKNANLGELSNKIKVPVPPGYVVTTQAYREHLDENKLVRRIREELKKLEDPEDTEKLQEVGKNIRKMIKNGELPEQVKKQVRKKHEELKKELGKEPEVAVRSSATSEDLKGASFAGQQDTYLNVKGIENILEKVKECFASLYTNRAIYYRERKNFNHMDAALSAAVQKMVDSESSGVIFTIDLRDGNTDTITIEGSWGLGEYIVKGTVTPDTYFLDKETLEIKEKKVAEKEKQLVNNPEGGTQEKKVPEEKKNKQILTDEKIQKLARYSREIEKHYEFPQDIEWAFDKKQKQLYILQSRPETAWSEKQIERKKKAKGEVILKGMAASPGIGHGKARVVDDLEELDKVEKGDILITKMTNPDMVPAMRRASAIITDEGGLTCFTGDTKILTSKGFMTMKQGYEEIEKGKDFEILSYDYKNKKPEWKKVIKASSRRMKAIEISTSQKGTTNKNKIGITPDHKIYTYKGRELIKKKMRKVLNNEEHIALVDSIPSKKEQKSSEKASKIAYLAGVVLTDGYTFSNKRRGAVIITQKETKEKEEFINRFKDYFKDLFNYQLKERIKTSSGQLGDREVNGTAKDFACYKRDPADLFIDIEENLDKWVLNQSKENCKKFLAGMLDGDGSIHRNRIHLYIQKDHVLQGAVLACLRLGIVPQVTTNRNIWNVQILEAQEELIEEASRIEGETWEKQLGTKLFPAKQLLRDVVDEVNYEGKIKPYVRKNLLIGSKALKNKVIPLAEGNLKHNFEEVLNSNIRFYRVSKNKDLGERKVYNFEVDEEKEMEKNYIVFTSRYTPLLVSNSHASIVSRELGISCVVGTGEATEKIKDGEIISVDGTHGEIFKGVVESEEHEEEEKPVPETDTNIYVNLGVPEIAEEVSKKPVDGVGLMREEFILATHVKEHPLSLIEKGEQKKFIKKLKQGILKVAKEFHPRPVVLRLSDFKTNEYRRLKGGAKHEPEESNPMIGWRGCSRYTSEKYQPAFELELKAIKQARKEYENIHLMLPFVRTLKEIKETEKLMKEHGLERGKDLKIWMMAEVPSNVLLTEEFAEHCDGFSIGTNDLTQLILGADRDSELLAELGAFDQRNKAVKKAIKIIINKAHEKGKTVSICGQLPSIYPEFSKFLVKHGIDSISVNPDTVEKVKRIVAKAEEEVK